MKFIFFVVTILLGLFFTRGKLMFAEEQYTLIQKMTIPGYMILCGIMVGYLIGSLWLSSYDNDREKANSIYAMSLVFGLILGVVLALINMYYIM